MLIQHGSDKRQYVEELYNNNSRMIAEIAYHYKDITDFDDLCQEGFFGLIKAAETWQESKEVMFCTYAYSVIKSYLLRYIYNNCTIVRLPSHMRRAIYRMKKYTDSFYKTHGRKPSLEELSQFMDMPLKKIESLISSMYVEKMESTSEPISGSDGLILEDTIRDPEDVYEKIDELIQQEQLQSILWDIVDSLDNAQGTVIREKYQNNTSVDDMAVMLGTTPSAIRTLEHKAFRELRKSKNIRKLEPFHMSDSKIFSISINYSGLSCFNRTWTSSPERAVMMTDKR